MRSGVAIVVAAMLFIVSRVSGQDLLGFFLSGDGASFTTGGDPFSLAGLSNDSRSNHNKSGRLFVHSISRFDNIYHETRSDGSESGLQRIVRGVEVHFPFPLNNAQAQFRLDVRTSKVVGSLNHAVVGHASYESRNDFVTVGVNVPFSRSLSWNCAVGQATENASAATSYEAGFSYFLGKGTFDLRLSNWSRPQFLLLNVSGVQGILPLDFRRRAIEGAFTIPLKNVLIQLKGHEALLAPLTEYTREHETHFSPNGIARGIESTMLLTLSENVTGLFLLKVQSVKGRGNFYSRATTYGSLDRVALSTNLIQAGLRYEMSQGWTLTTDLKWQSAEGGMSGYAESWPFVSLLQSSFSRQHFEGRGTIRLLQAHVGETIPLTEDVLAGVGFNFVRLITDISLEAWQTKFLSFGQRSLQSMTFPFSRLDGVILSGGMSGTIGSIGVTYSFSQIVPLQAKPRAQETGTTGTPNPSPLIEGAGGQFHQLLVLLQL